MMSFEYRTVDIPTHNGRPAIDPTLNEMAKEGWRPITIITPTEECPSYSIVFERKVTGDNPYDFETEHSDWIRWCKIHMGGDPHP